MISSTGPKVLGLNINIKQFQLSREIYRRGDDIRVSITTLPEQKKCACIIPVRQMGYANIDFCVNVTLPDPEISKEFVCDCTEKIIVVFRRKSFFFGDPIIASTIISAKDFPQQQVINGQSISKKLQIYEPYSGKEHHHEGRKVLGQMNIELKYIEPISEVDQNDGDFLIDYLPNPKFGDSKETQNVTGDENYYYNHLEEYQRV